MADDQDNHKWFQVLITIPIRAATSTDAADIALGACEHLQDTFNDDDSIGAMVHIEVGSTTEGEGK